MNLSYFPKQLNSILVDLFNNTLSGPDSLKKASQSAMKTISHQNPNKMIEFVDLSIQNSQEITPDILNLFCRLFLESLKELHNSDNQFPFNDELNLKVFASLQFYCTKVSGSFQLWDDLSKLFITAPSIAKALLPLVLNPASLASEFSYIILYYCTNFMYEEIIFALDLLLFRKNNKFPNLITAGPHFYFRFLSNLCKNHLVLQNSNDAYQSYVSLFLSAQFPSLIQFFLDNPFDINCFNCISQLFNVIYPSACPLHLRIYVARICNEMTLSNIKSIKHLIHVQSLLIEFSATHDSKILKMTVEFILKSMSDAYIIEYQKHVRNNPRPVSVFPIDATEMDPSFTSSQLFTSSVENLTKLSFSTKFKSHCSSVVISCLLEGIDNQRSSIVFKTISALLHSSNDLSSPKTDSELMIKFNDEEILMIISSITAATTKKVPDPSLCRLSLDFLKLPSKYISETEVNALTNYLIKASLLMHNSHYLLQIVSADKSHHHQIFTIIAESLFDETKLSLIPSLLQTLNLFGAIFNQGDPSNNDEQHPLVPFLFKKSIKDKSLFLLRLLSCLISLGAIHPFVPSMINILSIYFDFTFPLAFSEIKLILDAVTKRINSLHPETQLQLQCTKLDASNKFSLSSDNANNAGEFASIIMSLLSNIMKLINDSQFRISLCVAVIQDVEMNQYQRHNQNCLWIFDTIIPFLPFDVSSTSIDKLFAIISFYPDQISNQASSIKAEGPLLRNFPSFQTLVDESNNQENTTMTLTVFADVLGSISGRNDQLMHPIITKWKSMKSNSSYLVGKKQQPIPYTFIAMALASISREAEVHNLLEIANSDLFPLLIYLMKRKSNDLHFTFCLNALIELCARLTFHKVPLSFTLLPDKSASNVDFIFKYIINLFLSNKQKSMFIPCLAALRYFIQVPPCLTSSQRTVIREKVITTNFISLIIDDPDQQLFSELRGLILGMVCALPETATLVSIICSLMPLCENKGVISLLWRSFSIFEAARLKNIEAPDNLAQIKFYKHVEVGKIAFLPKIIADLLCSYYTFYQKDQDTSSKALQSIYLIFRIDRNIKTEIISILTVSDLAKYVLNELSQPELDSFLTYSLDGMKKHNASAVNYSFVVSQIMKYAVGKEKLTVLTYQIEQICADSISLSHTDTMKQLSLSILQANDICRTLSNLSERKSPEFPSLFFVHQLIIHYPDIFVQKLIHFGFSELTCLYLSKAFGEETGICVELLIQQLCLMLFEITKDEQHKYLSSILFFIGYVLISSTKRNSFTIPLVHLYQIICSLLIFGFSAKQFDATENLYKDEFIQTGNSTTKCPSNNPQLASQIPEKHLFICILGIALYKLKTTQANETNDIISFNEEKHDKDSILKETSGQTPTINEKDEIHSQFDPLSFKADKSFKEVLSLLINRKENYLLIDMLDFFMSSLPLKFSQVSSGIAVFCGEVLNHFSNLFDSNEKHSEILNLYFKTLLSLSSSFDEFTYLVSIGEITKFIRRTDLLISTDVNDVNPIFSYVYLSRILRIILKRLATDIVSKLSGETTNNFLIATLLCLKQFVVSFQSNLNTELTNSIFSIIFELLKSFGVKYTKLISEIIVLIGNSQASEDKEIHIDHVKLFVLNQIITCRPLNNITDETTSEIPKDHQEEQEHIYHTFDVDKDKESVCFVLDLFLASNVPSLISSTLLLLRDSTYDWIVPQYIPIIAKFLQHQNEIVAEAATLIIESLPSLFI